MIDKHTPGPLLAFETQDIDERTCIQVSTITIDGFQEDALATIYDMSNEGWANAFLFAAAPAMLEALEDIGQRPCFAILLGEDTTQCGCPPCTARAAIEAAKGKA